MSNWLVMCSSAEYLLYKKRFTEVDCAEVLTIKKNTIKTAISHMEEKQPVLCIGMPPEEILKTKTPEKLYVLMEESPFSMKKGMEVINDKTHLLYMDKRFCHDAIDSFHKKAEFILPDGRSYMAKGSKRQFPVLFVNSYLSLEDGKKILKERTSKYIYPLLMEAIKKNENDYNRPICDVWREVLEQEKLNFDEETIDELLRMFYEDIIVYTEREIRAKTVEALIKKEIPLALVGENWDVYMSKLGEAMKKFLTVINPDRSRHNVMEAMKRAKVVVNVNRFTQEGISTDVQLALSLGCIVVTERNPVTEQLREAGLPIFTYEAGKYSDCVKKVQKALKLERSDWKDDKSCPLVDWMMQCEG